MLSDGNKPGPNGSYYSALEVAYHWIEEAGETVVYLIPDGDTDIPKGERTGVYPDAFEKVLAHKNDYYENIRVKEAKELADAEAAEGKN